MPTSPVPSSVSVTVLFAPAVPPRTTVESLVILSFEEAPVSALTLLMAAIFALSEVTMLAFGTSPMPSPR